MKSAAAGLGNQDFDSIGQQPRRRCLIAADIIESHVAEGALLPVTAVCHCQLVPVAFGPETVHGVERIEDGEIGRQRESHICRRA